MSAAKLRDRKWTAKSLDVCREVLTDAVLVESQGVRNRLGSDELLGCVVHDCSSVVRVPPRMHSIPAQPDRVTDRGNPMRL